MDVNKELQEAIGEIKQGNKIKARELVRNFIKTNPNNEKGWWIYAKIAQNIEERIFCLEKVIEINPGSEKAIEQLKKDKESKQNPPDNNSQSGKSKLSSKNGLNWILATSAILVVIAIVFILYVVITNRIQSQKFTVETVAADMFISEITSSAPSPTLLDTATLNISLTPEPNSSWTPNPTDFPTPAEPTPTPTPMGGGSGFIAFQAYPQNMPDIFTLDLSSLSLVQLTFRQSGDNNPKWSPDGSRIIYYIGYDKKLNVIDFDGNNDEEIANDVRSYDNVWSPDGSKVIFTARIADITDIYYYDFEVDTIKRITDDSNSESSVMLSPDGNKVYYTSRSNEITNIFSVNIDGSGMYQLTSGERDTSYYSISPDGNKIAYISKGNGDDYRDEIRIMNVDGTEDKLLTRGMEIFNHPIWLLDNKRILFNSEVSPTVRNIFVVDLDGNTINITANPGGEGTPNLSPDGKLVAYPAQEYPWSLDCFIRILEVETGTVIFEYELCGHSIAWRP